MTAAPVIAFAPPAPPRAEAAPLSASTVSVAITDLQRRGETSSRLSMALLATSPFIAAVHTISQCCRNPHCWVRR
jgi:hypothetical protein